MLINFNYPTNYLSREVFSGLNRRTRLHIPININIQKRFSPGKDKLSKIAAEAGQKIVPPAASSNASQVPFNASVNKNTPLSSFTQLKEEDRAIQPSEENNKFPRIDPVKPLSEKFQETSFNNNPPEASENESNENKDQTEDFLDKIKTPAPFVKSEFGEDSTKKSYLDTATKFGLLDNDFTPKHPTPVSNSDTPEIIPKAEEISSTNKMAEAQVILECEKRNIIYFGDSTDYLRGGETKLDSKGIEMYAKIRSDIVSPNPVSVDKQTPLFAGILHADEKNTVILTDKQIHFVVGHDNGTDSYYTLGYLTSQKSASTVKLSDNQPISGENKEQRFFPFSKPLQINIKEFKIDEDATAYVQKEDITKKIETAVSEILEQPPIIYNTKGVTKDELIKMIQLDQQNDIEKQEKKEKQKPLNSLQEDHLAKKEKNRKLVESHIGAKPKDSKSARNETRDESSSS